VAHTPEGDTRSGALGHGEVLSRCAGGPEKKTGTGPHEGGPEPFLQNGIVMTDESRLG